MSTVFNRDYSIYRDRSVVPKPDKVHAEMSFGQLKKRLKQEDCHNLNCIIRNKRREGWEIHRDITSSDLDAIRKEHDTIYVFTNNNDIVEVNCNTYSENRKLVYERIANATHQTQFPIDIEIGNPVHMSFSRFWEISDHQALKDVLVHFSDLTNEYYVLMKATPFSGIENLVRKQKKTVIVLGDHGDTPIKLTPTLGQRHGYGNITEAQEGEVMRLSMPGKKGGEKDKLNKVLTPDVGLSVIVSGILMGNSVKFVRNTEHGEAITIFFDGKDAVSIIPYYKNLVGMLARKQIHRNKFCVIFYPEGKTGQSHRFNVKAENDLGISSKVEDMMTILLTEAGREDVAQSV